MMYKFLLGAVALTAVVPALAQTVAPPVAPVARAPMVDRVQTRAEVVGKVREHFARLDTNRDGSLTQAEADAGRAAMKAKFAERRGDRSGIGHTMNVKRGDGNAAFDRLDANRDGAISRDEFAKGREVRIERRVERQGAPGGGGQGMRGTRMHRMGGMIGGHMFTQADLNKDGRVTLQEATDLAVRHFDMADANRDGQVTRDERRQMHRQMIETRRAPTAG